MNFHYLAIRNTMVILESYLTENGELMFFSKSTNEGEKAERFKEIFYKYTTKEYQEKLLKLLKKYNCSLTCEVIDMKYDPHIIKEDIDECIVYLDLIKNELGYQNLNEYHAAYLKFYLLNCESELNKLCDEKHIHPKSLDNRIYTKEELDEYVKEVSDKNIEGVVIHSKDNKKLVKIKTNYYNEWKACRYLFNKIKENNGYFEMRLSQSPLQVQFGKWYSDNFDRLKEIDNIIELRDIFEREGK